MNLLTIKEIAEKKNVSIRKLADSIAMSEQNLHRCIKANKIQAHQLEIIANILETPIEYFFNSDTQLPKLGMTVAGNGNKVQNGDGNIMIENQAKEIEHLQQLLIAKEEIIETQKELIKSLKK